MPFTFSHPAIILPLKQVKPRWFSLTGLVAGSVMPDFEYFFRVKGVVSTIGETLPGLFVFNLPLSIIFSLLFHELVRNPLILHLPKPFDRRFSGFLHFNFRKYLRENIWIFFISCILGALSHLALDFLTSTESLLSSFHKLQLASHIPDPAVIQASLGEKPFLLMERTFSVVGLVLMLYLILKINNPDPAFRSIRTQEKRKYFITFFTIFALGVVAARTLLPHAFSIGQFVIECTTASLLSLLIVSLVFRKSVRYGVSGVGRK